MLRKCRDYEQNDTFNHIVLLSVSQFFLPEKNFDVLFLNNAFVAEVTFRSDSKPVESRSYKYLDLPLASAFELARPFLPCCEKKCPKEHGSEPE